MKKGLSETFDVLIVGDSRFSGGSTGALVADVVAMSALGLKIGLMFVRSAYLDDSRDPPNPKAIALLDLPGVSALEDGAAACAKVAFLHHPMVFYRGIEERAALSADKAVIVTHHAPFRADGSIEFNPMQTLRNIQKSLGLRAAFAPISGFVRRQLASFAPLISLSDEDWPNIFDPEDWPQKTEIFCTEHLTIGRHGRADLLKWPNSVSDIHASLPQDEHTCVRILGCPSKGLAQKGVTLDAWEVLQFGSENVPDFLNSLDVFVYHHNDLWRETFGRTVAEALMCGRLCLLDHRLSENFGDNAQYCRPSEVKDVLRSFREDPTRARLLAKNGRESAITEYGQSSLTARLSHFMSAHPTRNRDRANRGPIEVARKLIGHHRRKYRDATG